MSTRYVQQSVERMRDDPNKEARVTLLLGLGDTSVASVREQIEALNGAVVECLPFETVEIEVPEEAVSDVCDISGLESIETDESLEDLISGNPNSPKDSTT